MVCVPRRFLRRFRMFIFLWIYRRCKLKLVCAFCSIFLFILYNITTQGNFSKCECQIYNEMAKTPVEWVYNNTGYYQYNGVEQDKELPFSSFAYPLDINLRELIDEFREYGRTRHKPINIYPYRYIIYPSKHVNNGLFYHNIEILFLVKSAVKHSARRLAIRDTWANESLFNNGEHLSIKRIFLIGLPGPDDKELQETIDREQEDFGDILQMTFIDNYYNNTLKTVGGIHWTVKNCLNVKFVMLVDDDFIVNTKSLLIYTRTLDNNTENFFMGHLFECAQPIRRAIWNSENAKWRIPVSQYPFKYYPPFVSAGATLMSISMANDLSMAFKYTKLFIFDDIYLAIVNYKLGVTPLKNDKFIIEKLRPNQYKFYTMLVNHGYDNPEEMKAAWKILSSNSPSICASFNVYFAIITFVIYHFQSI